MKPIIALYIAISADGYIATIRDKTPWSANEWKCYKQTVNEYKNLVIG